MDIVIVTLRSVGTLVAKLDAQSAAATRVRVCLIGKTREVENAARALRRPPQLPLTHPSVPLSSITHTRPPIPAQKLTGRAKDDSTVGKRTNSPIGRTDGRTDGGTMVLLLQLPHTESVSRKFTAPTRLGGESRPPIRATSAGTRGLPPSDGDVCGSVALRRRLRERRRKGKGCGAGEREVVKYRNLNCLTLPGEGREKGPCT